MKQIKKSTATLIAASAAVLGLGTPATSTASAAASAVPTAASGATGTLKWADCGRPGLDERQQCATVTVPMDYAHPGDGRTVDLVISRIRSEKPSARRGALLMIPGGPGGDSLADPSGKGQKLPQDVRDGYDLIGFAPRGQAPSTAVSCGLDHDDLALTRLRPWPAPDGSVTENLATARRTAEACARNGGELMKHISSVDEARDIDSVRAALGERKLSVWGVSYGTYVGSVYSQLFPRRTDRVVLDSNDNPDPVRVERAWLGAFERGVEDNFPVFADWAAKPGNRYRLADTAAEVRPLVLRLAARLDRDPLPWPGANPEELNGNVLRQTMLNAFYDPDDYPMLAQLILAAQKGEVPPVPAGPPESVLQNVSAVGAATICNDAAWPTSSAFYQKAVDKSRARYPLTAGMPRNAMLCAAWPYAPKQAPVRITDQGPANVLLIQNERDVATPLAGARKLRTAFGDRAVMVVNDSAGHDAYLDNGTACGDRIVSRFLATGERPARDRYCR
ncbi:alpha/beta hydrolase [Streptomyces sp. NPDC015171]|uniref:alpha/beta hydrolase n=1 Tax=Streptomyces sp. NPDC015171 TaxID=3364945 RepID=UPI003702A693